MSIRVGNLRGEKIAYEDGVSCCVWYPFDIEDEESFGICFDVVEEDIDDLIRLLWKLKYAEAEPFEPTEA